ncbi:TPA: hypothetical protein DDZ49_00295 [Candidatus Wolfebacteria bacterium]|uniref:Uncharacterized protein n=1 Tax=Candidatus Wolfebacteria bacterium GW2011_GWB1_47_1 TaxID=1619007 RepID=A0A0G4AT63_9BACT|nr:MAG: hypothetical protein UX70_C0001G1070 [Candidatus Wolfebacteria bacterium GW2011_GWB1_47_1]KKU59039.1 MAG: hypothetical protein UX83_C0009G0055 [Candidatus Wolfebacteria bacterium GW2011_GWE2_47_12]KKU65531.1 MAG: hypothetical protein UX90_C0004G0055 [Candidatus Wolfebacteria bacterium GW2011_GWD2_47_17]HAS95218.1 hypothetical protein [Candidatus Wolfebacteria bacterium]HBN86599.1 hypothetical protein [Candidatus Wolfebacteria bacterium]
MEGYRPSQEEINKAEEQMGPKQKKASEVRATVVERFGSSDAEYINDLKNLKKRAVGSNGFIIEGVVKGHKVYVINKDGYNNWSCIVDGKDIEPTDAYRIGTKYNKIIETGITGFRWSLNALEVAEDMAKGELFQEEQHDQVVNDLLGKTNNEEK